MVLTGATFLAPAKPKSLMIILFLVEGFISIMKHKLPSLDLHGIYHREVDDLLHNFLNDNLDNLPVEVTHCI